MNNSRDKILNRIRQATSVASDLPNFSEETDHVLKQKIEDQIPKNDNALLNQFKIELEALSAEFYLVRDQIEIPSLIHKIFKDSDYKKFSISNDQDCQSIAKKIIEIDSNCSYINATDLKDHQRKDELANISIALVKASFAVADIGSLVFQYDQNGTSLPHFLSDCVFALVERKQLLPNQFELLNKIDHNKSKNMVFMAGPSRTADIEKVLVLGAHGPRRLIVIMVNE
jgi:L-lactate dehydrogenase complex protein LldG